MVQKLLLDAHFKITFCWLSSLDVSIRESPLLFILHWLQWLKWLHHLEAHIHQTRFKIFLLQFSSHRIGIILRCTLQKTLCHANCAAPHQNKFRVFLLNAKLIVQRLSFGCAFQNNLLLIAQLWMSPSEPFAFHS